LSLDVGETLCPTRRLLKKTFTPRCYRIQLGDGLRASFPSSHTQSSRPPML
jgi:hypothetical protein